ncbi:putative het-s domain protein [Rosellinia necatrix]|uniref:Putative het-s domain protein n=1 Tax=Rosellinia necatrix TaxID=77044 RepID=A0A1W2TRH3_ROSNE|nr:putative het-s domain protein [Rosellinia necatrix]
MESYLPRGMSLGVQRRLSRLYNDTKKSSDFVQEPVQAADDPEIKALHRKLRIQKDRLVSWGLEWSDPNQSAEIDESLNEAGLSDLVGSIMATIKDILAEAEPLWLASKRPTGSEKSSEKASGDRKAPLIIWDKGRFEDLVKDLTASIDTLCDLSRTRSSAAMAAGTGKPAMLKSSVEDLRPYSSTRIQTPRQIDPQTLLSITSMRAGIGFESAPSEHRPQEIFFMSRLDYSELIQQPARRLWSPLLVEYAEFDPIYSATGIMPEMTRFERLSAGLQTESSRSPGAWIGLPLLLGYYEDMERSRLALVYSFPPTFKAVNFDELTQHPIDNMCTLANLLNRPNFEPTLEAKFRLAYNLANTIFDMHSRGITHGNLHASTISFTNTAGSDTDISGVNEVDIRRPLISSFDIFPNSSTSRSSSTFLLHRHPLDPRTTSQSPLAVNRDTKTLDLYSLAMMLVSIGLWTTLENLIPSMDSPSVPESVLGQLAIRCGTPYMRAVQACWNAVELELSRPGNDDEIIRHIQTRASGYLEACCILDGVSGLDDRLGDDFMHTPARPARPSVKPKASAASLPGSSLTSPKSQNYDAKRAIPQERSQSFPANHKSLAESQPSETKPDKPKEKQPKLRLYPQIPLPAEIVEQWNEILMPQINLALRHFYRKHPESVEISLESIGESPQKTTPTVLVVCTSVNKVRAILNKKLGILFDGTTTNISLKVCRGSVVRSRKGPPTRSMAGGGGQDTSSQRNDDNRDEPAESPAANPDYQEKPRNGASIGAWIGDKHLPPVSLGGVIIVDDKPYGMTVHHMLDDPDRPFQASDGFEGCIEADVTRASAPIFRSSAAAQDLSYLTEGETSSESSDFACEFSDTESEYSATDITSDEEDEDEDEDEEFNEPGDIPGIEPGCGDGYIVTQPALDDVPVGFYPSPETEDEDHIDTYRVGEVYASSGIRRRTENNIVHEIDWALFEFQNHRLPDRNLFPSTMGGDDWASTPGDFQPVEVVPARSLPGLDVQCMARTSGSQVGRILPTLTTVKIYGRASPSHSYQVSGRIPGISKPIAPPNQAGRGVSLGIPGDSGAWIVDRFYGRLCGHILAWSQRKQVAYVCPMDVLLLDIAETLQARDVRLPNGESIVSMAEHKGDNDVVEISGSEAWTEDDIPDTEDVFQSLQAHRSDCIEEESAKENLNPAETLSSSRHGERFRSDMSILARDMDKIHIQETEFRYGMK